MEPHIPETGYGYIKANGNRVVRFVEKPTLAKAGEYLESGDYLWNSGMFCFSAGTMRREMQRHCPELLELAGGCLARAASAAGDGFSEVELDAKSYTGMPDISIDYAVMEKTSGMAVVPCNIGWNDIGSWNSLGTLVAPDANGNRVEGE